MIKKIGNKKIWIIIGSFFFYLFIYLFYHFINCDYESDFDAHISTVQDGRAGYSLMHVLIFLCYSVHVIDSNIVLSFLMGMILLLTIVCVFVFLNKNIEANIEYEKKVFWAFTIIFTSNIYIPVLFPYLYNSYTLVSQPWHNSTYILMRLFSIVVIILFFEIWECICKDIKVPLSKYASFTFFLFLCNYSKPNFFIAFAPGVLVISLVFLLRNLKKNIKVLLPIGISFLVSMFVMLYQVKIVYGNEEGSYISFSFVEVVDYLSSNNNGGVLLHEFANLLFPLFVLLTMIIVKYKYGDVVRLNRVLYAFLFFTISHLQKLIMIDEGPRRNDGNYSWGVYDFGLILFMICLVEWITLYKKGILKNKKIYYTGVAIYFIHIISGMVYFLLLIKGNSFLI